MNLAPGSSLGPYEIVSLLGAGGMGEVYRARDHRLDRDVAIKVLPPTYAADPDRLHRFEQEARATAALNDPNIVAIYDVGAADGQPYVVAELLDGETLRSALGGGAAAAAQGAEPGAADRARPGRGAPARHRPPRSEARERLRHPATAWSRSSTSAWPSSTEGGRRLGTARVSTTAAGLVLGTVGYMSPEQARGEPVGSPLRHLLVRRGALRDAVGPAGVPGRLAGRDAVGDPQGAAARPDAGRAGPVARAGSHRRSLPREEPRRSLPVRRRSALRARGDLGRVDAGGRAPRRRRRRAVEGRRGRRRRWPWRSAAASRSARRQPEPPQPRFQQLTFRRGAVQGARFAADGQTIVYAAAWEGRPDRALLDPARGARGPAAADDRDRHSSRCRHGRDGGGARARGIRPRRRARWPGRRWPAACRGSWRRACWPPTGAPTDRSWRSSAPATAATCSSTRSARTLYDPSPATSPISASRRPATPWPSSRIRCRAIRPATVVLVDMEGQATTLSSRVEQRAGPGVGAGRPGGLVHRHAHRRGAGDPRRESQRPGAADAVGAGDAHAARRLARRPRPGVPRRVGRRRDGPGPGSASERDLSWLDGSTAWDLSRRRHHRRARGSVGRGRRRPIDLPAHDRRRAGGAARRRRAAGAVARQAVGALDAGRRRSPGAAAHRRGPGAVAADRADCVVLSRRRASCPTASGSWSSAASQGPPDPRSTCSRSTAATRSR